MLLLDIAEGVATQVTNNKSYSAAPNSSSSDDFELFLMLNDDDPNLLTINSSLSKYHSIVYWSFVVFSREQLNVTSSLILYVEFGCGVSMTSREVAMSNAAVNTEVMVSFSNIFHRG